MFFFLGGGGGGKGALPGMLKYSKSVEKRKQVLFAILKLFNVSCRAFFPSLFFLSPPWGHFLEVNMALFMKLAFFRLKETVVYFLLKVRFKGNSFNTDCL